jgi:hypothetical protein
MLVKVSYTDLSGNICYDRFDNRFDDMPEIVARDIVGNPKLSGIASATVYNDNGMPIFTFSPLTEQPIQPEAIPAKILEELLD